MADELAERLVRELAALRARVAALERQEGLTSPVGTSQIADGAVTAVKIVGGHGSGVDADKLDGLEASAIRGAGAVVKRTTTQTIPDDVVTAVSFDTELADIGDCFDPNQPNRITVPTNGVYLIWGQVRWAPNTNGFRDIHIRVAETDYISVSRINAQSGVVNEQTSAIWYLQSGQIVQLTVYQTSGGNLNIEPYNGHYITLGVFRLY